MTEASITDEKARHVYEVHREERIGDVDIDPSKKRPSHRLFMRRAGKIPLGSG